MGRVYLVDDRLRQERCVLKRIDHARPELAVALEQEFAVLAGITHPHLLRVRDFGVDRTGGGAVPYYTADFIEGATLAQWATQNDDIEGPWLDALEGLAVLHGLGLRHGDFTPSNVLVRADGGGVLIDLGCVTPFSEARATVSGTPGFLAPELEQGRAADGRADLYSAGRTLGVLYRGARRSPSPKLSKLLTRLTHDDPAERPTDCTEVLEAFGRKPTRRASSLGFARRLIGRDAVLSRFDGWLTAFDARRTERAAFVFSGPPGVGTSRLLQECAWRAERRVEIVWGSTRQPRAVTALLERALGTELRRDSLTELAEAVRRYSGGALLLLLDEVDQLPEAELTKLSAFVRLLAPGSALGLVVTCHSPDTLASVPSERALVEPLDLDALRVWTGGAFSARRLGLVHRYTGGLPGSIVPTLAALYAGRLTDAELASGDYEGGTLRRETLSKLLEGTPAQNAPARRALALLAALGGDLDIRVWPLDDAELSALERTGLVERVHGHIALRRTSDLRLLRRAVGAPALAAAHRAVAGALERDARDVSSSAQAIRHLTLGGDLTRAEEKLLALARQVEPRVLLEVSRPLVEATRRPEVLSSLGSLALAAGDPASALRLAARTLATRGNTELRTEARLMAADALLKLGRAPRADRILGRILAGFPSPGIVARTCEARARAAIQLGEYVGAQSWSERGLSAPSLEPAVLAALLEARAVARIYLGDRQGAEDDLNVSLGHLGSDVSPRTSCRFATHRAIAHYRAGDVSAASACYRDALRLAEQHQLDDLCAVGLLNLGTSEHQAGSLGEALSAYERGLDLSRALGRTSTELTLRYNLANLYAEIGASARASDALQSLLEACDERQRVHFEGPVALLRAECALFEGKYEDCEAELDRAQEAFSSRGRTRELFETEIRRAESRTAQGRPGEALELLRKLSEANDKPAESDLGAARVLAQSRARIALGDATCDSELEAARRAARAAGLRLLEVQLESELSAARLLAGATEQAEHHEERARRLWDRMASGLPSALRDVFWRHPRRRSASRTHTFDGIAREPSAEVATLRKLLSVTRRLNSALSVERVLDAAIDAAVELTGAERGFLLTTSDAPGDGGSPRIAVARSEGGALSASERPSRSVVEQVLRSELPLVTTDAQRDPRLAEQRSVHALRLKSILCVPISSPARVLGALYVDNRLERGRFSSAAREILQTLADQVAIALSNAHLYDELARRTEELEVRKRAVERLSQGQARSIARLERRLETQSSALSTRYDYARIAGRGPAMRAVLEKLDRITDASVDVLVRGASGTGKELVARALHHNGPRKTGPFVAVNCAALPETLLESELFGHVRGAFTGAERDREGLLVAANGGTLFLDELGEMPLATQAKLLRVLQEREVRPVGATRSSKLDVRLVCATNRSLREDVTDGRFREDLYYRVAVVEVVLPSLAERTEDVPEIAAAILRRLAQEKSTSRGGEPPELTRSALRMLMAHPWPGNVRELENTLTRAFVLSDGARITERELELEPTRERRRSRNRDEFEADERERILEALRASSWNVSQVSRALAIPRNTLYRKMQKYGMTLGRE